MSEQQPLKQQAELELAATGRIVNRASGASLSHLALHELSFTAMGVECQVLTLGKDLTEIARARILELDQAWSRFRDNSELSLFNSAAGRAVDVSPDLMILLERSLDGYRESHGLFDPFLGRAIVDMGYDKDFDLLPTESSFRAGQAEPAETLGLPTSVKGEPPVSIDYQGQKATLHPNLAIDSGGIGKGLGADMVVRELVAVGAAGALVNLGGDAVVGGAFPDEGWRIGLAEDIDDVEPASVVLRSGSVCSSGVSKRQWIHNGQIVHHILDPATGEPLTTEVAAVSAIAESGWQAEVLTKVALIGGRVEVDRMLKLWPSAKVLVWSTDGELAQISAGETT